MEARAENEATDGPVMNFINKRIRNLRKKYKRITQIEEAVAQGKSINKEQEDVLHSKPGVCALIDELEKLRSPLSVAVSEEVGLAVHRHQKVSDNSAPQQHSGEDSSNTRVSDNGEIRVTEEARQEEFSLNVVEDLLNLLYFGSLFDVKTQNDFTSMMYTRTLERGCCLTYDYVTDDDTTELLGEKDLDMLSMMGGLVISRPVNSSLSHKNALQQCIEHAKCWISKSNQLIEPESSVTYAELRERLSKIMATDYFTTTPELKAPVDVAAAAAENFGSFQVSEHAHTAKPVQVEGSVDQYQQKDDYTENLGSHEEKLVMENAPAESEEYQREAPLKEQNNPRRSYPNQRGGRGGGRRGYSNGRGGRNGGSRGGGYYENGRNQYNDHQPSNYYPKNNYNNGRGRNGRGGGQSFNNRDSSGYAASGDYETAY